MATQPSLDEYRNQQLPDIIQIFDFRLWVLYLVFKIVWHYWEQLYNVMKNFYKVLDWFQIDWKTRKI